MRCSEDLMVAYEQIVGKKSSRKILLKLFNKNKSTSQSSLLIIPSFSSKHLLLEESGLQDLMHLWGNS